MDARLLFWNYKASCVEHKQLQSLTGHWVWRSNQSAMCIAWPPWRHVWHHVNQRSKLVGSRDSKKRKRVMSRLDWPNTQTDPANATWDYLLSPVALWPRLDQAPSAALPSAGTPR